MYSLTGGSPRHCPSPDYNLAMVLAGIVVVFVVCHSFRFFLAFYHVSIVEKTSLWYSSCAYPDNKKGFSACMQGGKLELSPPPT